MAEGIAVWMNTFLSHKVYHINPYVLETNKRKPAGCVCKGEMRNSGVRRSVPSDKQYHRVDVVGVVENDADNMQNRRKPTNRRISFLGSATDVSENSPIAPSEP